MRETNPCLLVIPTKTLKMVSNIVTLPKWDTSCTTLRVGPRPPPAIYQRPKDSKKTNNIKQFSHHHHEERRKGEGEYELKVYSRKHITSTHQGGKNISKLKFCTLFYNAFIYYNNGFLGPGLCSKTSITRFLVFKSKVLKLL